MQSALPCQPLWVGPLSPAPSGLRGEGGGGGDLEQVKGLAKKSDPSLDKVYHLYFELA